MDVGLFIFLVTGNLGHLLKLSYTNILRVIWYAGIETKSLETEMSGNKIVGNETSML